MEGLKFGWLHGVRSGVYHYIPDFSHKESSGSICNKYATEKYYAEKRSYLEKYEILDTSAICPICELKVNKRGLNNSKKETLTEINEMSVNDGHILKNVVCSEENCDEHGVAFVSTTDEEKPHYCIKHNLQVQEIIRREKELEIAT